MFTVVFEQGPMLKMLSDLLPTGDVPSIMGANKQMHIDLGNCRTRWWGCTWNKVLATRRKLWRMRMKLSLTRSYLPLPSHQDIIDWPGGTEPSIAAASGA